MAEISPLPSLRQYGPKKDATAAERQKRYRKRRKQAAVTRNATVTPAVPVTPAIAHPEPLPAVGRGDQGVTLTTTVAALSLATVSAGFSITGMTGVFVGATLPVIGMGVALELGKLSAVACLGRRYGSAPLRAALVTLVAVLMGLNAVGAYGFLAKAHIGHQVEGYVAVAGRAANVDAKIIVQTGVVADLDRRLAQIDGAVEKATAKGRASSAMALADQQRKTRASSSPSASARRGRSLAFKSRRPQSMASAGRSRPTWALFDIWRRCSAPATRMSCDTSSSSSRCCWTQPRCCCCWPRPRRGGGSHEGNPLRPDPARTRDDRAGADRRRHPPRLGGLAISHGRYPMRRTAIHLQVGQRVVCIDASPNRRYGTRLPMLRRGGIYVIRAIDQKPAWQAPGWGVHLEGISIVHPDAGCEWAMKPERFRPVVDRPTDIEIFRKLLTAATGREAGPPQREPRQLRLPW